MSFVEAIKSAFQNYTKFQTRASRSEYWYFALFAFVVTLLLLVVVGLAGGGDDGSPLTVLPVLWGLAILLPALGLAVRRLHDAGRSGWWLLAGATVVGLVPLLIWMCTAGRPGPNRYGVNPLDEPIEDAF